MKVVSVYDIKAHKEVNNNLPAIGTRTREIYDLLINNKGIVIELWTGGMSTIFNQLINRYGLDIRVIKRGSGGRHAISVPSKVVLAGEWFGRVYVDYIAERIKK